jgi:cyclic dehypoxanthinyl futalosine synthase
MDEGTALRNEMGIRSSVDTRQYIRLLSTARILLPNISHIQASWLTTGITAGQICLHAGADDFGSVMIEENVVSQAGARHSMDSSGMQAAIVEAGFIPRRRNQLFEVVD